MSQHSRKRAMQPLPLSVSSSSNSAGRSSSADANAADAAATSSQHPSASRPSIVPAAKRAAVASSSSHSSHKPALQQSQPRPRAQLQVRATPTPQPTMHPHSPGNMQVQPHAAAAVAAVPQLQSTPLSAAAVSSQDTPTQPTTPQPPSDSQTQETNVNDSAAQDQTMDQRESHEVAVAPLMSALSGLPPPAAASAPSVPSPLPAARTTPIPPESSLTKSSNSMAGGSGGGVVVSAKSQLRAALDRTKAEKERKAAEAAVAATAATTAVASTTTAANAAISSDLTAAVSASVPRTSSAVHAATSSAGEKVPAATSASPLHVPSRSSMPAPQLQPIAALQQPSVQPQMTVAEHSPAAASGGVCPRCQRFDTTFEQLMSVNQAHRELNQVHRELNHRCEQLQAENQVLRQALHDSQQQCALTQQSLNHHGQLLQDQQKRDDERVAQWESNRVQAQAMLDQLGAERDDERATAFRLKQEKNKLILKFNAAYGGIRKQLDAAQETLKKDERVIALQLQAQRDTATIEGLRAESIKAAGTQEQLRHQVAQLTEERTKLSTEMSAIKLLHEAQQLAAEKSSKLSLEQATAKSTQLEREVAELTQEAKNHAAELQEANSALDQVKSESSRVTGELAQAKASVSTEQEQVRHLQLELQSQQNAMKDVKRLQDDNARLQRQGQLNNQHLQQAQMLYQNAMRENATLRQHPLLPQTSASMKLMQGKIDHLASENRTLTQQLSQLQRATPMPQQQPYRGAMRVQAPEPKPNRTEPLQKSDRASRQPLRARRCGPHELVLCVCVLLSRVRDLECHLHALTSQLHSAETFNNLLIHSLDTIGYAVSHKRDHVAASVVLGLLVADARRWCYCDVVSSLAAAVVSSPPFSSSLASTDRTSASNASMDLSAPERSRSAESAHPATADTARSASRSSRRESSSWRSSKTRRQERKAAQSRCELARPSRAPPSELISARIACVGGRVTSIRSHDHEVRARA